jgi:hypothetical protein
MDEIQDSIDDDKNSDYDEKISTIKKRSRNSRENLQGLLVMQGNNMFVKMDAII